MQCTNFCDQIKTMSHAELCRLKITILNELSNRRLGSNNSLDSNEKTCPLQCFYVSKNIKCLDSSQLDELTQSFRGWLNRARNSLQRNSRIRVWFIFLLLRYTGIRLGEVLALDDTKDIDYINSKIIIDCDNPRQIYLPRRIVEEMLNFTSDKKYAEFRGKLFKIDPGFVRKKFYEQEKYCSITKKYLCPSVLRNSRAVELLKQGVPLPLLKIFLGHQSIDLTAKYFNFLDRDADIMLSRFVSK